MKKVIPALVAIIVAAAVFWLLADQEDPAQKAASPAEMAQEEQPKLDLSKLPPPEQGEQHIDPHLRALLLAAIAQNAAQKQQPKTEEDAGISDAAPEDAAQAKKPLSRRRKIVRFQRETRKLLAPIARECLKLNATKEPQAIGPEKRVEINLQGTEALGTLVTNLQLFDANGPMQAPAMQQCMQDRAFALRLPAPPIAPGKERQESRFSFPMILPNGSE